jgi:hypothetical protein
MEVSGHLHAPSALPPGETAPGTHGIGGWVVPRAVLDAVVERKISCPRRESNPRTPIVQPVAQRYTDWAITALNNAIDCPLFKRTRGRSKHKVTAFREIRNCLLKCNYPLYKISGIDYQRNCVSHSSTDEMLNKIQRQASKLNKSSPCNHMSVSQSVSQSVQFSSVQFS